MTYPDILVATILNECFVPVQVNIEEAKDLVKKFRPIWTPNINILTPDEFMVYHMEGWLPPSEFAAMLLLARGHFSVRSKRYEEATPYFKAVVDRFSTSNVAPEAQYYTGVSRYMATHEVDSLLEEWKKLQVTYPQSDWALRARVV